MKCFSRDPGKEFLQGNNISSLRFGAGWLEPTVQVLLPEGASLACFGRDATFPSQALLPLIDNLKVAL